MANEIEEGYDGLYSLCVFNAENCSDDEIHEVFGKFGDIIKMNRNGDKVFVRYGTLEEATQCYENMQGDTQFNVRPGRKKRSSNDGRDWKSGEMNRNDNSRGRRPEMGGSGDFNRFNSSTAAKQNPPKLIPFPSVVPTEDAASKPTAKMVVIGNLNPKMGQNNVYQLCTKVKAPPLHVAMRNIKRPPYPNILYALVYVRNDTEVESIVSSYNNLKLNGYKMVVSSTEKLNEEGKALLSAK